MENPHHKVLGKSFNSMCHGFQAYVNHNQMVRIMAFCVGNFPLPGLRFPFRVVVNQPLTSPRFPSIPWKHGFPYKIMINDGWWLWLNHDSQLLIIIKNGDLWWLMMINRGSSKCLVYFMEHLILMDDLGVTPYQETKTMKKTRPSTYGVFISTCGSFVRNIS